jgi:hypothetical protein
VLRAADTEVMGWTLNVSRGGVRIIVEDAVELGKEYRVMVGDGSASPRPGRVVWVQDEADGQIAGVQFLDVEGSVPPAKEDKPPPAGDGSGSAGT